MMYNKQMPTIDILTRLVIVIVIIGLIYFSVKRERFATACGMKENGNGCRIQSPCHCGKLPSYCDCKERPERTDRPERDRPIIRKSCCSLPDMYSENSVNPFDWGFFYSTDRNPRMITKF